MQKVTPQRWCCVSGKLPSVVVDKPINVLPGELRCPSCFGKDIVPSMPRGWRDSMMRAFGRIPQHCRFCERRFYIRVPGNEVESADRHE